jgi:general secretion pathway protein D
MKNKHILLLALSTSLFTLTSALAQGTPPGRPSPVVDPGAAAMAPTLTPQVRSSSSDGDLKSFEFSGADLDTVMSMYCEWTGKIYLKNDSVTASISLKADRLTVPECIEAVESILAMNNVVIVPYKDKFLKVMPANSPDLMGNGPPSSLNPETSYAGGDKLVTQLVSLKNVQIQDVQTAIQHLMHSYGKIQTLGAASLLITDTEDNILRIRELVDFLDQDSAIIEPRFYEIAYAEAADLASTLNEIITMAQADQQTTTTTTSRTTSRTSRATSAGIRAGTATPTASTLASISNAQASNKMIIQGSVKVMADERTNLILIFSQKENFDFFDHLIKTLDVEVEPEITFEVVNLEYADAEDISSTLNELVGAAQSTGSNSSNSRDTTTRTTSGSQSSTPRITPNASSGTPLQSLSKLSENTKILADTRSNSIILSGRKSDIATLKEVLKHLDIMLEQVVIEAAIFEIGLTESLSHGIDWLYQATSGDRIGGWGGSSLVTNSVSSLTTSALSYYQNFTGLDSQMLINLAATDNDARLISTPVIMTTDNTEATLSIGEQRPVVTSTSTYSSSSGTTSSTYEYKDIGIQLTITPRINPQRLVVMELTQSADQIGGSVTIDDNDVPVILNREFSASISVPDRGTVVLGGLISTELEDNLSKIPLLGDIPLIGRYLFSSVSKEEVQRELLVLMTPYVMTNQDEVTQETERLYQGTSIEAKDWPGQGWSQSKLSDLPSEASVEYPVIIVPEASPTGEGQ